MTQITIDFSHRLSTPVEELNLMTLAENVEPMLMRAKSILELVSSYYIHSDGELTNRMVISYLAQSALLELEDIDACVNACSTCNEKNVD